MNWRFALGLFLPLGLVALLVLGALGFWWSTKSAVNELGNADPAASETPPEYDEPPANLDELIDRYIATQGGKAEVEALRSLRIQGRTRNNGSETKFDQIKRSPGMSWTLIEADPYRVITTTDGETVWRQIGGQPDYYRITGTEAESILASVQILSQIWILRNVPDALEWTESREIDGTLHHAIRARQDGKPDQIFWIDDERYLERRIETVSPSGEYQVTTFHDYRKVGPLTVPFKIVIQRDGEVVDEIIVEQANVNIGVLSALFSAPDDLKDWPPSRRR